MTPNHYHQPDVHPGSPCSNQWGVLRNTQFLCLFENHRQESILPQGYLIKMGLSEILCLNLTLTWRLPSIYLFSCPEPRSPFLGLCKQHCNERSQTLRMKNQVNFCLEDASLEKNVISLPTQKCAI